MKGRLFILTVSVLLTTGCASLDGIRFGLSVASAEAEMNVNYGGGKAVVEVAKEGGRLSTVFQR